MQESIESLNTELTERYGTTQKERIERGLSQVARFWRPEDGDAAVFEEFVRNHFAGDDETLDAMLERFEFLLEQLDGHMNEILLSFKRQADLDIGAMLPFDEIFAGYAPNAHVTDDFFANKLAFVALLNFPLTTLEERLNDGKTWSRRQWAEVRLAQRFSKRIPGEVKLAFARIAAEADRYIADYNIWMHHLLDGDGNRMFPPGLRLLSHWNLRDELKANYADEKHGLAKQRMIQEVMNRIVMQTIPAVVINNPHVDWNPYTNKVQRAKVSDCKKPAPENLKITNDPEPDTRYRILLETFHAEQEIDRYSPFAPSLIARRFDEDREIPEERVKEMLVQVVSSPVARKVAKEIEKRLGRPLEPFDIWYNGFRPKGTYTEAELNEIVSKRYPTAKAYDRDMPRMLVELGFSEEKAEYLAASIDVEAARGSGHAWEARMRSANARLRTRVGANGMDYKGFSIAVHEMGHNVEQVISLKMLDHTLLAGVPNTAFTEAFAFIFQARDLELLGLETPHDERTEALRILHDYWSVYEISGVALVDMEIWHWMYDHPDATVTDLKKAVIDISKDIWNKYFAPVIGVKDVVLLGVYSHIIHSQLYIPDYPMGHLIAFQIEEQMQKAGSIGAEFERMAKVGTVAPDLWMQQATGSNVGADALLAAAEHAIEEIK
ncbi:MAG: hypothetical protein JSV33_13180 [bacterium]|nr:MAG: hypothetical protein JSV33_13180 [bacterium]